MPTERRARVAVAEDTTALQLGHNETDDILVGARRVRGGDDEAVARATVEPRLHLVGDVPAGADEAWPLQQGRPVAGEVGQGDRVAADMTPDVLHQTPDARHG